jgi:glycosyltransferase involved in cell wall biosynthesis
MPDISVIICTHNPRLDYLLRVLDALKAQTLPLAQWELLLVDNSSKEPLASVWDLSWHPRARHIREEELGLTPARLRGIKESASELLAFVDDDNVLAQDYLSNALKLSLSHPCVGAFGGSVIGEFETPPESWAEGMLPILALVNVESERWICSPGTSAQLMAPCGAGMVIRKNVATFYAKESASNPLRRSLDRKGASLVSSGDIDMALCACVLGLAIGRFPQLRLIHLIAARRLKRDYLLRLAEESAFSDALLHYVWDGQLPRQNQAPLSGTDKIFQAYKLFRFRLSHWLKPNFHYEYMQACNRGLLRAVEIVRSGNAGTTQPAK